MLFGSYSSISELVPVRMLYKREGVVTLDACPYKNTKGYDVNLDGCIDKVCDLPKIVQSLGLHYGIKNTLVQEASNARRKFNDGRDRFREKVDPSR